MKIKIFIIGLVSTLTVATDIDSNSTVTESTQNISYVT